MSRAVLLASIRAAVMLPMVLVGLWACPPTGRPPQTSTDAGDGATPPPPSPPSGACADACTTLARLGCAQGERATCPEAMQQLEAHRLLSLPDGAHVTCADVADARTRAAAAALGVPCSD